MPWVPELFTAPALAHVVVEHPTRVPFFAGLVAGETDALIASFAAEPELHHPVRGRVKGAAALERFAAETTAWMAERDVAVEDVGFIGTRRRGIEEIVLHLDGDDGRVELPVAIATDHHEDARIVELRLYFSTSPLTGGHAVRPPLLQPDGDLAAPDVVGDHQRALAAGDVAAAVAAFEADGYLREAAGGARLHRGAEELGAHYERLFSDGGGIPLEQCTVTDDGRACALEYNVVASGRPVAGLAVYVRGESGRLAAARMYDDTG